MSWMRTPLKWNRSHYGDHRRRAKSGAILSGLRGWGRRSPLADFEKNILEEEKCYDRTGS